MIQIGNVVAMTGERLAAGRALPAGQVSTQPLGEVDEQTAKVVDMVFLQLQAIFPAWRQAWPDDKALALAKRSWTKGLQASGIRTIEQVRFGIEQCRRSGSAFAPSIGQFVAWCLPTAEMMGLPTEEAAWREAVQACTSPDGWRWSHEAVRLAVAAVGFWELRQGAGGADALRRRFGNAYAQLLGRLARGETLAEPMQALEWDGARTAAERADMAAEQALQERLRKQGLAEGGRGARADLLAQLGIKRGNHDA
ncbi:phage replication protein P [Azotobacter beijerinckii]|uniref:Phage replication protein P n=1 Tax=Azotobacter beijerinckii TaxID=170623 RepID=A0A1H9JVA4_9GAMM|nr:replication protein P [Azotobacter beijerinckii]SEQ90683.1 phage replication protein P [Azotobacter beijerinckii]